MVFVNAEENVKSGAPHMQERIHGRVSIKGITHAECDF